MRNMHQVNGTLYWDSMEAFYADTEDFIERRGYDVSHMDNRERVSHAVNMASIDMNTQPFPPETPDALRVIRMYIKGMGGLQYAKSVLRIKAELLPPPDYYTDEHAAICRCELCIEREAAAKWDEQLAQTEAQDWLFESYLLHEEQYDMPSWAERYDW